MSTLIKAGLVLAYISFICCAEAATPEQRRASMLVRGDNAPALQLKSHIVNAEIKGRMARVAAESVYRNDSSQQLEATYVFPLPEGATVEKFIMWMDGKPVEAKMAEKDRARNTYESIVSRKKDPGLIEQIGDGLFKMRVFPVLANSDQKVRIEYSQVLPVLNGNTELQFVYPLYSPVLRDPGSEKAQDFVVALTLEMEGPIASLKSISHRIGSHIDENAPNKATVSIEESGAWLDRDFSLKIALKKAASPITSLAYRAEAAAGAQEDGTLMLFITPTLPAGEDIPGKDVVLVMDISGSMQGEKFRQAQESLRACLQRLRPADRFALISFSDSTNEFHPKWCEASPANLEAARGFVDGLEVAGGTNIGGALKKALSYPQQPGRLRQILFATDGCPTVGTTNVDELTKIANAGAQNSARFFTFGIGYDVNTALLDRIAAESRGERAYVKPDERIEQKLSQLCDKISAPILSDVSVTFSDNISVQQIYPPQTGDLYLGRQAIITARYKKPGTGTIILRGKRGGKDVVIETPVVLPESTPAAAAFVQKQWALRKVGFLLDQMRLNGENAELKDEVVRLGTRFSIVTPYTSYLALERPDRERFDKETAAIEQRRAVALTSKRSEAGPPTDPTSSERRESDIPPDILAKAELGDHFETINPDRPDTQSAFGNPDAHVFREGGGGNDGGVALDDLIGVGGGSRGSGGGWGGGEGSGTGVDQGSGRGSFGNRNGGGRKLMVKRHGGSIHTESSSDMSMLWLANNQNEDGHWDSVKFGCKEKCDTQATALALLAFLGAGHTEKVGKFRVNVSKAVDWLISKQAENGLIFDSTDAHAGKFGVEAIQAVYALAEAAGMSNVAGTRNAAQKAIDYCAAIHQPDEQGNGDVLTMAWRVMALKSAKVAALRVERSAFDEAINYLAAMERKEIPAGGQAAISRFLRQKGVDGDHLTTAAGLLSRQFLGFRMSDLQDSVEAFIAKGGVPTWKEAGPQKDDLMYWYVGTLCVFQQGGDVWKTWNEATKKALVDNQIKDGELAGSWTSAEGGCGRVGTTALSCLCLEVYYRYLRLDPGSPAPAARVPDAARPADAPRAADVVVPPAPEARPQMNLPKSDSGRDAVDYSEYLRQLQEGKE